MIETKEENNIELIVNGLGVFELRAVARQLGIHSPTTKKRDELIDLIKEALKNGATLKDSLAKRGRPFKRLNVLDSITDKINNEVIKLDFSNTRRVINFEQDTTPIHLDDDECCGIIQKYNYTIEMIDMKSDALVKFDKTEHMNELLQLGDKVCATVNKIDGVYHASRIISINDVYIEKYRSVFVDKGEAIISNELIPFDSGNAIVGRRNVYKLKEELFETNHVENLLNYCNNNEYTLIILAINTSFENEIQFTKIPTKNKFMASYGSENIKNYRKILDAINYAENLVNRGKKVVLLVSDIIETIRALEKFFAYNEHENPDENYNEATRLIIKKLLGFGRAYQNDCNGTLIMCYNQVDSDNAFLINDIMKISKKINE